MHCIYRFIGFPFAFCGDIFTAHAIVGVKARILPLGDSSVTADKMGCIDTGGS